MKTVIGMLTLGLLAAAPPVHAAHRRDGLTVTLSTTYAQLLPGQTLDLTATVSGGGQGVIWQVNNANGGTAATGTVTQGGVFTAPQSLPSPAGVTVTAVSQDNPGVSATASITLLTVAPGGTTYYVAKTGSDANRGTQASPFLTIGHAAGLAGAGDTVMVEGGIYNELVAPVHSGNVTQGYITFSAMPGQVPIIDGKGLGVPNGQAGLFTLGNVSYVVVQGFELQNYSSSNRELVPIGIYVFGAGSNVQIVNDHIHDIAATAKSNPNRCANALGLAVYGSAAPAPISALVVSGNELDHLTTVCSESMSLDGNVDGFAVTSNLVHDNDNIGIDAIGFERVSKDPQYDQARNGEIRGNTVYDITSYGNPGYGRQHAADGIYVDGGTQIIAEQNLIYAVDIGIELASEHKDHVTSYVIARNNVIYDGNSVGISIGGYKATKGGTDHASVVNNTTFNNYTARDGSGELQIQFNATNNIFENNIVYASQKAVLLYNKTVNPAPPATLDYNLYFSQKGADQSVWVWNGKSYQGFSKYQADSGQDAHSLFADPLFDSLQTPFSLNVMPNSPAIGAGANLGQDIIGSVDFAGNPRVVNGSADIGAYQSQ